MSPLRPLSRVLARRAFSTTPRPQLAKMTIVGRLGAEPEVVGTQSGQDLVRYSVGTNQGVGDKQTTSWWRVASFAEEGSKLRERLIGLPKGFVLIAECVS